MKWMLSQHAPDCCVREPNPPSLSPETIPLNDFYLSGIISLRMSVSTIETYATTFERVKRISRDCSSLEWIGKESNLTTWNNGSLSIHKLCPLCASYPLEYYPPPIFCLQGLCRVNQYRPFGHPVRPRTGLKY